MLRAPAEYGQMLLRCGHLFADGHENRGAGATLLPYQKVFSDSDPGNLFDMIPMH